MKTNNSICCGIAAVVIAAWSTCVVAQVCDGDSGTHASVTVEYGLAGVGQRVTYEPSNDGTLRAIDAERGVTLWVFGTEEADAPTDGTADEPARRIDRMTDVRVLRFDANQDGVIDISSGDKVWLYFGTRRTGTLYYALDVTDRSVPRVLWAVGSDVLEGAGEAWSTPTIARVRVAGAAQNGEHFVVIVGGGYTGPPELLGNRLFMLDAATGRVLWAAGAGGDAEPPDLVLDEMLQPIPARVAVLDTDGDQFADRMYAADVSGKLWRFDIWNGRNRAALVTGGVFADLGSETVGGETVRRFFNAPDVALIQHRGGDAYYNVAIGSGDLAAIGATVTGDRFYSVRDRQPFTRFDQAGYAAFTAIVDVDLVDITGAPTAFRIPPDAAGWKLELNGSAGAPGMGEKVVAESLTANGVILFTTYQPPAGGVGDCAVGGAGRVYAVHVDSGTAALDLNGDESVTPVDISKALAKVGMPGALRLEPPASPDGAPSLPGETPGDEGETPTPPLRCLVGGEVVSHCAPLYPVIRTFWQLRSVN